MSMIRQSILQSCSFSMILLFCLSFKYYLIPLLLFLYKQILIYIIYISFYCLSGILFEMQSPIKNMIQRVSRVIVILNISLFYGILLIKFWEIIGKPLMNKPVNILTMIKIVKLKPFFLIIFLNLN